MLNSNRKKIGIALVTILILAIVFLLISWLVLNWDTITSKTTLVTQEQADQAYKNGYNQGKEDSANNSVVESLEAQIASLKSGLSVKENELQDLSVKLKAEIDKNNILTENVITLTEQVSNKNIQIQQLKDRIAYYETIIENAEQKQFAKVTFKSNDQLFDIIYVEVGEKILVELIQTPANTELKAFTGWADQQGNLIDFSNQVFNANTTLIATFDTWLIDDLNSFNVVEVKDKYVITNETGLRKLSDLVLTNDFQNTTIYLGENIVLADEFTPIGSEESPFKGNFNGLFNQVTINNLTINARNVGFFGYVSSAKITNLKLDINMAIENLDSYICFGALVGYAEFSEVSNIEVFGSVSMANCQTTTSKYLAGIIGDCDSVIIENSTNNCNLSSSSDKTYIGGIAGMLRVGTKPLPSLIKNCLNRGILSNDISKSIYSGGIVYSSSGNQKNSGYLVTYIEYSNLQNCVNSGAATAGLIYSSTATKIINCINYATVKYGLIERMDIASCMIFSYNLGSSEVALIDRAEHCMYNNLYFGGQCLSTAELNIVTDATVSYKTGLPSTETMEFLLEKTNWSHGYYFDYLIWTSVDGKLEIKGENA